MENIFYKFMKYYLSLHEFQLVFPSTLKNVFGVPKNTALLITNTLACHLMDTYSVAPIYQCSPSFITWLATNSVRTFTSHFKNNSGTKQLYNVLKTKIGKFNLIFVKL